MSAQQKTINSEVSLEGAGIHTGKRCTLKLLPAPAGTGIAFVRVDLPNRPQVKAQFGSLVSTSRRTALASEGVRIETVEHMLAAMYVLELDNCLVEIDTAELPALDGSALTYYNLLSEAGVRELEAPRDEIRIDAPVEVNADNASITVTPAEKFSVSYLLSYPQVGLEQSVDFSIDPVTFGREIAPARTFVLEEEIKRLQSAGFGKGADENNTVVLAQGGAKGELRFADEPARHKVLDLLGDLFFLGGRLKARVECKRSGHALNRELVRVLLDL